jgi:uncharacterized protein (TIGR03067 family)
MRAHVPLVILVAAVVGCGPKPADTPTGEPGSPTAAASLDGVWVATKVEVPPGFPGPRVDRPADDPAPTAEELASMFGKVSGNLLTVRLKHNPDAKYFVVERDEAGSPKTVTLIESDEKGSIEPVKTPATQLGGKVVATESPRVKMLGIYTLDGDTLKVAVNLAGGPAPTEFAPKIPKMPENPGPNTPLAELWPVIVVHLARHKEAPEWAAKLPTGPTPTSKPAGPARPPRPASDPA